MDILVTIGDRLTAERKRLGLNQTELAALGGIELKTQGAYENDKRSPKSDYLTAIAEAGVDVGFVLTGNRSSTSLEGDEARVVNAMRMAAPAERATIVRVVAAILGQDAVSPAPADNLPSKLALTHMFEALLVGAEACETTEELADLLAEMLPVALRQLEGPLIEEGPDAAEGALRDPAQPAEPRQAQHT